PAPRASRRRTFARSTKRRRVEKISPGNRAFFCATLLPRQITQWRARIMTMSMYQASVPVFNTILGSLSAIIDKAVSHAEVRKIDPAVLVNARLYPDMLPFTAQVQIACDMAKFGAGRLSGAEIPKHD